ncbi:MAG: Crp/Fnr family transcriptional regulator [Gammaproteobacteria bacterium]|nr:Crp/Fnr family transcriptional regulator [Gammaproteobacteria bacterium]
MKIILFLFLNFIFFFDRIKTEEEKISLLVIYETQGFVHKEAIREGKIMMTKIGKEKNYNVIFTDNSASFKEQYLEKIDVIIFLCTTLDILNENEEKAMKKFIRNGGGFIGIHSATDTEYEWEWYGKLVGAYFMNHPEIQKATIITEKKHHFLTDHLKGRWKIIDEWYNFKDFNPDINVLLSLDESTYEGGENGNYHPISWFHEFEGGRSFYTGLGHVGKTYNDPRFVKMINKAILYTSGLVTK